jgi:Ca2+-transporting ATPase
MGFVQRFTGQDTQPQPVAPVTRRASWFRRSSLGDFPDIDQAPSPEDFVKLMEEREMASLQTFHGVEGVARSLASGLSTGLADVASIEARREKYGENALPDPKQKTFLQLFLTALSDKMLIILMIAAIVSLILYAVFHEEEDKTGWVDSASILIAVVVVALVQSITDYRQQQAFTTINRMKNDNLVSVIRSGERVRVRATEIVVGDLLYLDAGNKLVADGLFVDGRGLKLNESETTGETLPVTIDENHPFMCSGATVEAGDGHMLAVCVGVRTQAGAIFAQMGETEEEEKTPLGEKLEHLASLITWFGVAGATLTFLVLTILWGVDINATGWRQTEHVNKLIENFMVGVTIFVCAVPEGLPLAVTISLSYSMSRMMEDNNFVRHLDACETMGGASNICSDKTGTLTTNRMTVTQFWYAGKDHGRGEQPDMPQPLRDRFGIGVSVNTKGKVTKNDKGVLVYDGKSTECALVLFVEAMGYNYEDLRHSHETLLIIDFDSDRKRMSTVIQCPDEPEQALISSKGAPEVMIELCTHYINEQHEVAEVDQAFKDRLRDQLAEYSAQCLRSLLIAYRVGGEYRSPEEAESDLTVIGVAAISDPIREEVPGAIKSCRGAGVTVRMVTGDNIDTARAIAKECGILSEDDGGISMTGNEFRSTPKLALLEKLPNLRVLARSTPMDKFRLVRILKELGEVVAVTGDGTNDAIALKTANVGLSMGLCGTEIAKEASDIVILDDNFKSIMMAMMWGRCVFDNVRRFLQFQLTVNVAAVVIAFIGSLIEDGDSPLKPIQLLWVNMIMDSFGALALATEKPRPYLLERPPYGRQVQLLSGVLLLNIIGQALYQVIVEILIMTVGDRIWTDLGDVELRRNTLVFNVFVFSQIFNLLNSRVVAKSQSIIDGIFSNYLFIVIFLGIAAVQAIITEFGGIVFHTCGLTWVHWLSTLLLGVITLALGVGLRLIPVKELTYAEVEQTRQDSYEKLKETLRGMSDEQQWQLEQQEQAAAEEENKKKKKPGADKSQPEPRPSQPSPPAQPTPLDQARLVREEEVAQCESETPPPADEPPLESRKAELEDQH